MKTLPPTSYLHECFSYDPETGALIWRRRPAEHFKSSGRQARWNKNYSGKIVGCGQSAGYRQVAIDDNLWLVHRIVWKMMTGDEPVSTIDHADRDKTNNRWANLREATYTDQVWNRSKQENNTTGYRGVSTRPSGRFRAYISVDGKQQTIGTFNAVADAYEARKAVAKEIAGEFYWEDKGQ